MFDPGSSCLKAARPYIGLKNLLPLGRLLSGLWSVKNGQNCRYEVCHGSLPRSCTSPVGLASKKSLEGIRTVEPLGELRPWLWQVIVG